jgi:RNA polymerase sigma factor (sigma-70 family)
MIEKPSEIILKNWQNSQGWDEFYNHYYNYFRSLTHSYNLNHQDSEDVVQEIFLAIANQFKNDKFDSSKGCLHAWVQKFAKWRIIDIIRRNKTQNKYFVTGDDELMESQACENSVIEDKSDLKYKQEIIKIALNNLKTARSGKEYYIFCDIFLKEMSKEEIVEKYKVTVGAVYVAKHKMARRLQSEIKRISKENV